MERSSVAPRRRATPAVEPAGAAASDAPVLLQLPDLNPSASDDAAVARLTGGLAGGGATRSSPVGTDRAGARTPAANINSSKSSPSGSPNSTAAAVVPEPLGGSVYGPLPAATSAPTAAAAETVPANEPSAMESMRESLEGSGRIPFAAAVKKLDWNSRVFRVMLIVLLISSIFLVIEKSRKRGVVKQPDAEPLDLLTEDQPTAAPPRLATRPPRPVRPVEATRTSHQRPAEAEATAAANGTSATAPVTELAIDQQPASAQTTHSAPSTVDPLGAVAPPEANSRYPVTPTLDAAASGTTSEPIYTTASAPAETSAAQTYYAPPYMPAPQNANSPSAAGTNGALIPNSYWSAGRDAVQASPNEQRLPPYVPVDLGSPSQSATSPSPSQSPSWNAVPNPYMPTAPSSGSPTAAGGATQAWSTEYVR